MLDVNINALSVWIHHLRNNSMVLVASKETGGNLRLFLLEDSNVRFQDVIEEADPVGVYSKGKKIWVILYQPKPQKLLGYYISAPKRKKPFAVLTEIARKVASLKITKSPQHIRVDVNNRTIVVQMRWNGQVAIFPGGQEVYSLGLRRKSRKRPQRISFPNDNGAGANDENPGAVPLLAKKTTHMLACRERRPLREASLYPSRR